MQPDDILLTPRETAEMFGVDMKTVGRWAKEGKLPYVQTPTGYRRYFLSEVTRLRNGS